MTQEQIVGTWDAFKTINKDGSETMMKRSRIHFIFKGDGTGKIKFFLASIPIKWTIYEGTLNMINVQNGATSPIESDGEYLIAKNTDGTKTVLRKK